jgi:hypothetical protein
MAASRSSTSARPSPSTSPRGLGRVSRSSPRVGARFERGSSSRVPTIARTRCRAAARPGREQPIQLEPAGGAQHRRDMAVGAAADNLEGGLQRGARAHRLAAQQLAEGGDARGPRGEVGQSAVLDVAPSR